MELTGAQIDELRELTYCADVPATVGTRARIVLWYAENRPKKEIAAMAGVSRPTVNLWLRRYAAEGVAGLLERKRGAGREQVPGHIRARILAATRSAPPEGLSHWSSREMVKFIARTEGVTVSHHYVATLWRQNGLKPHRQGTFKHLGEQDNLSLLEIQAKRLDIDAGAQSILEQRDLVDVDGQQIARAACRWHVAPLDIAAR